MKRLLLTILLLFASTAWAGPFEDAVTAYRQRDYATALRLWRPFAEQGHALAQASLGFMYEEGRGVVQDYPEAVKWYRLAAAQGNTGAQSNLGLMYRNGQGVVQDYVRAHMWFNLAAAKGDDYAVKNRDITASIMTPQQIAEAQNLARECQARKFKGCD